jgi:hypothetical protein
MRKCFGQFLDDDHGMILSSEIILIGTILVLGSIAGLTSLQSAVTHELHDAARAYDSYNNHSYYGGSGNTYDVHYSEGVPEVTCAGY